MVENDFSSIAFSETPKSLPDEIPNNLVDCAITRHGDEVLAAEMILVRPSPTTIGAKLALKLKMSPINHVGPTVFELPIVVCPEGASINDPKNSYTTRVVVDLSPMYNTTGDQLL